MSTELITISGKELNTRIQQYEAKWPEFEAVYREPTCCPGHMIPYERWGFEQCNDWEGYYSLRWLRGDEITYEGDWDD